MCSRGLWKDAGGKLDGVVRDGAAHRRAVPSFELRSPAMADVVRDINKLSNNVMAQQLFLTLAATQRGAGTPEAARAVADAMAAGPHRPLLRLGTVVVNGSGLSRDTPHQRPRARQDAAGGMGRPGDAGADELVFRSPASTARCATPRARPDAPT